jgi:hypothetical protein
MAKVLGDIARTEATPLPFAGSVTPVSVPEMVEADATAGPPATAATARARPTAAARDVTRATLLFRV